MIRAASGPAPRMTPYPRRWAALALLLTAVFMDMIDSQIVTIALPTIERDLRAEPEALQWMAAAYTLAFALTLISGGRLGDRFGHRPLFVLGTAGFGVASLAAGLAPQVAVLLGARVAQGVCAGLMVPQVLSFIHVEFPAEEQGRAMAFYGMTFPVGGLAGPLLGGLLTQADLFGWGWRTIFVVNVPVAVAAAVGAAVVMPRGRRAGRGDLDLSSVLVLTVAMLAAFYPLVQGRELGWPTWSFAVMAAALPILALFVAQQRALQRLGRDPLIPPALFRSRALSVGLVIMLIFYCGMGAFFVLTLHLQNGLQYSPLKTALTMLPATLGIVAGNGIGMNLVSRLGRLVPMLGLLVLMAGTALTVLVVTSDGRGLTPWQLVLPVLLFGAGLGLGASSLMLISLAGTPAASAGAASGVVNTVVQLGLTAGPAGIGTAFFAALTTGGYVAATRTSLLIALGLFAGAFLACWGLPRTTPSPPPRPGAAVTGNLPKVDV